MVTANGLLELRCSDGIANEGLASVYIDFSAVNSEAKQIMEAQMRYGADEIVDSVALVRESVMLVQRCMNKGVLKRVSNEVVQLQKEVVINFAPALNVVGVPRHAAVLIIAHPLQEVWVVSASFKASGVPGPKAFALGAEHLVAAFGLVNGNFAIGAGFSVVLQKSDGSDGVGVANVSGVIVSGLEFPAMRAGVLVAGGALPSGRDEAVACGISAAVNELFGLVHI